MLQANFPKKIIFEEGSLEFLSSLDTNRVFALADENFCKYNPDVFERLKYIFQEKNAEYYLYFGEGVEPTLDFVKAMAQKMREHQPDLIIAIGGGSIIDAAKVMEVYYEHPGITDTQLMARFKLPPIRKKARFVAIPTTSGTGSEVTPMGVLYVPSGNTQTPMIKKGIADYQLIPDFVILDPCFTLTMPPSVTASTAIDAFVHCIEAYVCLKPKNVFGDLYALEGMKKIISYLPEVMKNPTNKQFREQLQIAATMGGFALANRASGASHGAGKQLSSLCNIAHGVSVAILLDKVIRLNATVRLREYAEIARYLGVRKSDDEKALEELLFLWNQLIDSLHFPRNITDLGIEKEVFMENIDILTKNALEDAAMKSNPVPLSFDQVKGLFLTLLK